MARRNDKRERLIAAADTLFHRQGVSNTTLANIATLAEVPLGNVYYYFKSKDSIIVAVVERRKREISNLFAQWSNLSDVRARLKALVEHAGGFAEEAAQFGDALGSLCQELGKVGGSIAESTSSLMSEILGWCAQQFKSLGKSDEDAHKLALNFIASLQGISLMTLTFKDASIIAKQGEYLNQWIEAL